jgi:hypothetical protein
MAILLLDLASSREAYGNHPRPAAKTGTGDGGPV